MSGYESQKRWVMERLARNGSITRNEALKNYISRLSAIIYDLKDRGWKIIGEREYYTDISGMRRWDYRYTAIDIPENERREIL